MKTFAHPPQFSRRLLRFTHRNYLVWRQLLLPSLVIHLADPVIFLLGFGLGIGALVGSHIETGNYLQYLSAGILCYGTMNSTSFEGLYSAFSRMHVQRTWESVLNTPMTLDDIILGEWLWASIKGLMAGCAILFVLTLINLTNLWYLPIVILVLSLTAVAFSGIALAINALARSYEFFSYYFTLFITPMMMMSGAFFPVSILPLPLQWFSHLLPLTHAVVLARHALAGQFIASDIIHVIVLLVFAIVGLYIATLLTRRRLLK